MWSLYIGALVILCIIHLLYKSINTRFNQKLPPGSMGYPFIGETIQFFARSTTFDVHPFVKERMERYGPIFRTSLVGRSAIVSTDPEFNCFIFQHEGNYFESWYPYSFTKIFGEKNASSLHGFIFKYLKNMVLSLFGPESLKKMLPEIEQTACRKLELWSSLDSIELKEATADVIFDLTAKKLISYDQDDYLQNLRENFVAFQRGLISLPINILGTAYHKCLQGRKNAMSILKNLLKERRANPKKNQNDFYDYVLFELQKKDTILTEEIALDLMFALLFASFETTSVALTLAIKFLSDHPKVLEQLTEEHEAIVKNRETNNTGLTWQEYKSMRFTFQVITETVRLANIAPVLFRKARTDIQFKGYTIPAGWNVIVCPPAVHLNSETYKDPLTFNPSRWEGVDLNYSSKQFMAFGGGIRLCVGADFTKLQMAVFLHCLVTKYRWKPIKGGDTIRSPGLQFPNGFHVNLTKNAMKN